MGGGKAAAGPLPVGSNSLHPTCQGPHAAACAPGPEFYQKTEKNSAAEFSVPTAYRILLNEAAARGARAMYSPESHLLAAGCTPGWKGRVMKPQTRVFLY